MQRLVYAEWNKAEYATILRALVSEHSLGRAALELEERLGVFYPASRVLLVNRGRYALELALRSFAELHPARDEVLYPGFICDSVISTIERCGLRARPIDVTAEMNIDPQLVEDALSDRTLAVIAAHMYGCPAGIAEIERMCRARGVFLVDDAAQVVGIAAGDRPLGTFGDVGLLSFSQSKTVVCGGINAGGALLVNDPSLVERITRRWNLLPPGHYRGADLWQFLRNSLWESALAQPCYYWEALRRRLGVPISAMSCPPSKIANTSAALALSQLDTLSQRVAGRRAVAALYQEELRALPSIGFPQYQPGRYLTRIMLELPPNEEVSVCRAALRRLGIQTRRAYQTDEKRGAALTQSLLASHGMVEVPSHSQMDRSNVKSVANALGEALSRRSAA